MPVLMRVIIVFLSFDLFLSPALAADKTTLDGWMDNKLIPSVVLQLKSHPRFGEQIVRFVVMQDGKPTASTNALALALRDRLQDAVVEQSGIRVGWQVDRENFSRQNEQSQVDCTTSTVHYYIGIDLEETRAGRFTVSVRALDIEDQSWVSGFGGYWQGTLTTMQHRAYRQTDSDLAYLGQRSVPFASTQTDFLAAQLAHSLGCSLLRQMSGEYVAQMSTSSSEKESETLELIGNNLVAYRALKISSADTRVNSVIEAKAHRIDDNLYQFWVTISPLDANSELPAISASAYIFLPETFLPAALANNVYGPDLPRKSTLIRSLEIVRIGNTSLCKSSKNRSHYIYRRYDEISDSSQCYALQTQTQQDSVVFFLFHQVNHGLVMLTDLRCSQRGNARVARHDRLLQFPLAIDTAEEPSWLPGNGLVFNPDADTYYAIASSNSKAARAISRHLEQLPGRCGYSVRAGLNGAELRLWFRELDAIAAHWPSEIDWRAVRVKNVY